MALVPFGHVVNHAVASTACRDPPCTGPDMPRAIRLKAAAMLKKLP
jgi:hypothetical protein